MSGLILKSEERAAFLVALKATKKPALEHRRMNVLLLLDDGWEVAWVAEALFLDARTVEEYRHLYIASGAGQSGGKDFMPPNLFRFEVPNADSRLRTNHKKSSSTQNKQQNDSICNSIVHVGLAKRYGVCSMKNTNIIIHA
jgi:hypothetical protein